MKRLYAIFFLAIFGLSQYGHLALFKIIQHDIKKEIRTKIKNGIDSEYLFLIKLPVKKCKNDNPDLKWKGDDELWYKDNLYDVVKSHVKNDTLNVYCVNDKMEEELLASLGKVLNNSQKHNNLSKRSRNILQDRSSQTVYFEISEQKILLDCSGLAFHKLVIAYQSPEKDVITPPPRV